MEFLSKMKKWCDMNNIPREFREKVDRLERNIAVSAVIFKKFMPIFRDVFQDPEKDLPKPVRGRKQRQENIICFIRWRKRLRIIL